MPSVRLLPFAAASGAENMARDEALLHSASDRGIASVRFYTWAEPTLSLGYFQASADRLTDPALSQMAWVRRATGGAAIVHDPAHEITYSLALPPGDEWQPRNESWICRMHHVIRDVLNELGVGARAVVCGEEVKHGPVLCFRHQTPGDLTVNSHKVAGSAQRKWKGALLQHGSILFSRSPLAPVLPGIAEQSGVNVTKAIRDPILTALARTTGWTLEPGDWTADEWKDAERIAAEKFAHAEWNGKR
ncbi:MAG: lipoate--protein ligase family protein [Fimbriiglobus sp.]|jgi:lipoate-protein ligase A|nr:lipoate--protein ligase family protein [Fimbriiglobus sp.]